MHVLYALYARTEGRYKCHAHWLLLGEVQVNC